MTCLAAGNCAPLLVAALINGLTDGAALALNAIAVTLIYGVIRTINLAHGDLFALATVLAASLAGRWTLSNQLAPLSLVAGLLACLGLTIGFGTLVNTGVEALAFRPFRTRSRLAPLIATLALSFMLNQAALVWRRTDRYLPRTVTPELFPDIDLFHWAGAVDVTFRLKDLLILLLALLCTVSVYVFLRSTRLGRMLRACADSPSLAQLCGVNREQAIRWVFVLGGGLAGGAAWVYLLLYRRPFADFGVQSGLLAFAAAILGGVGNPIGALGSGLALGVMGAVSTAFLGREWTPVLIQGLLILVLVWRPAGLTGQADDTPGEAARDSLVASYQSTASPAARWLWLGLVGLGLVYPALDAVLGTYNLVLPIRILISTVMALGMSLLLGGVGLLDLGYTAGFGIGGYTAALVTAPWGRIGSQLPQPVDYLLVYTLSAVTAGLLGLLKAALAGRLRSDYLVIATLALGQIVGQLVSNLRSFTGGVDGMSVVPQPTILGRQWTGLDQRYYLAFGLALLAVLAAQRLMASRLGRAWRALGDDETAASSVGVPVERARGQAFILSSVLAGLVGATYVAAIGYMNPDLISFRVTAMILAMVILGGAGSVSGAFVGALVVASYDVLIIPVLGARLAEWQQSMGLEAGSLLDVRGLSFLSFGLALYVTVLVRARAPSA